MTLKLVVIVRKIMVKIAVRSKFAASRMQNHNRTRGVAGHAEPRADAIPVRVGSETDQTTKQGGCSYAKTRHRVMTYAGSIGHGLRIRKSGLEALLQN